MRLPLKPKVLLTLAATLVIAVGGISWEAGTLLMKPVQAAIGAPPADLNAETVTIASASGSALHGWFVKCPDSKAAVALFHGVGANRLQMLTRARLLREAGYSVLLVDFQAEGESVGRQITFGFLESKDVEAAIAYLHSREPGAKIGAIGLSLGGASLALAKHPLALDAVVLESAYSTIDAAVANRIQLRLGPVGSWLSPLLTLQIWPRIGIAPTFLRPVDHLADVGCPVLIAGGEDDRDTFVTETKAMFDASHLPKELWIVPTAAHVDLQRAAPAAYRDHVFRFLAKYLKSGEIGL